MEVSIHISKEADKKVKYELLLPQLRGLFTGENDFIANMANLAAVLHESFDFLWTGFYLWKENELVLGPFQGPIACTRIQSGSGVCGAAYEDRKSIVVPNVEEFPGHIACSPLSKSEIVVPLMFGNSIYGVLDIDSQQLSTFDEIDQLYLEQIIELLMSHSKI